MKIVDFKAFKIAIDKIDDGTIFEEFSKSFLSAVLGHLFNPVGGKKDKGVDGFMHIFSNKNNQKDIFQISIEQTGEAKIRKTLKTLYKNNIDFDRFNYVTNKKFINKERFETEILQEEQKVINILDQEWFVHNVGLNQGTINAYNIFIGNFHASEDLPAPTEVHGLIKDPRLFVFLRQQLGNHVQAKDLRETLSDTLILYALEGTDPDKNIFKKKDEIRQTIHEYIKFNVPHLDRTLEDRLKHLSRKPRKINYHSKEDSYCLPFETRAEIKEKKLIDTDLYERFYKETEILLRKYLNNEEIRVKDCRNLLEETLNKVFFRQGLEFSNLILKKRQDSNLEIKLNEVIAQVVDNSGIIQANKDNVKSALLVTIREVVYNGSKNQKIFLSKLSNTYLMLFMLQCDPKISSYFEDMASRLHLYVGNSILVPALSEYFLEERNRRHCNLLSKAQLTGVKLIINREILQELIDHLKHIKNEYDGNYSPYEKIYLGDEAKTLFIEPILIRSYFYAKSKEKVRNFDEYLDNFVNPSFEKAHESLSTWLKETFNISYLDENLNFSSDEKKDIKFLSQELINKAKPKKQAERDAKLIVSIHHERKRKNELSKVGIFGYRTWWLSKDVLTQKIAKQVLGKKYQNNPYMRADFLNNYISLAPRTSSINNTFNSLFTSVVGINISNHLPSETIQAVHGFVKEHGTRNPHRVKSIVGELSDKIKSDPSLNKSNSVKHFLDEKKEELQIN